MDINHLNTSLYKIKHVKNNNKIKDNNRYILKKNKIVYNIDITNKIYNSK